MFCLRVFFHTQGCQAARWMKLSRRRSALRASGRQTQLGEVFVCNIRGGLIGKIFELFRQLFFLGCLFWGHREASCHLTKQFGRHSEVVARRR